MSSGGKTVPAESRPSSSDSPGQEIAHQMNTWLESLYDYFAQGDHLSEAEGTAGAAGSVGQTMQKVIDHLESITERLRARYPVAAPTAPPPNEEGSTSSFILLKKETGNETAPEQNTDNTGQVVAKESENVSSENRSSSTSKGTQAPPPSSESITGSGSNINSLPANSSQEPGPSSGSSSQRIECRICLETVSEMGGRKFALLEQCDHPYCEPCVRTLMEHNGHGAEPIRCPTCRTTSARLILREAFLGSGPEKTALFDSVLCCPPHQVSTESDHHLDDDEDEVFELALVDDEDEDTVLVPDEFDVDENDLVTNYTEEATTIEPTTSTEEEDSMLESNDDRDYLDDQNSSPSFRSAHSLDISVQINGRPLDVVLGETVQLLNNIWSHDDDPQTDYEAETETAATDDYATSYSSSEEETDHSFSSF